MTTKNVVFKSRNIIDAEIRALTVLIERREQWLNNPANKHKGTYEAVSQDTQQMKGTLASLQAEYKGTTTEVKA